MKRDFQLPSEDVIFLNDLSSNWETVNDCGMQWVIIHDYPIAPGYNHLFVSVAIKIETGYPRSPLDMAYFYPAVQRIDGQQINAICNQIIDGIQYQRWSRHRTPQNPWREGVDDLSTHMALVSFWFEQEFIKRANEIKS